MKPTAKDLEAFARFFKIIKNYLSMKKLLILTLLLATIKSNGQAVSKMNWVTVAKVNDTIPTILLCADTTFKNSVQLYRNGSLEFEGLTTFASKGSSVNTFTLVGYRVAGDILYAITSKRQLIDGLIYLDDKKRPLPASFIVFSFVDRKP